MNNTTLFGGTDVSVTLLDNTTKTVRVRQLPVREMNAFLEAQDNEARMIELVCQLDGATVDALMPDSHEKLVETIDVVNADFFSRWLARLKARTEKLMPGMIEQKMVAVTQSPLPSSLPNVASKRA